VGKLLASKSAAVNYAEQVNYTFLFISFYCSTTHLGILFSWASKTEACLRAVDARFLRRAPAHSGRRDQSAFDCDTSVLAIEISHQLTLWLQQLCPRLAQSLDSGIALWSSVGLATMKTCIHIPGRDGLPLWVWAQNKSKPHLWCGALILTRSWCSMLSRSWWEDKYLTWQLYHTDDNTTQLFQSQEPQYFVYNSMG